MRTGGGREILAQGKPSCPRIMLHLSPAAGCTGRGSRGDCRDYSSGWRCSILRQSCGCSRNAAVVQKMNRLRPDSSLSFTCSPHSSAHTSAFLLFCTPIVFVVPVISSDSTVPRLIRTQGKQLKTWSGSGDVLGRSGVGAGCSLPANYRLL